MSRTPRTTSPAPGSLARSIAVGVVIALASVASAADLSSPVHVKGAEIYKKLCVECHGDRGQGVRDKADDPLIGDRSVEWLAKRIHRSMPEDNEDACVDEDAAAVARYVYDAFYSPAARAEHLAELRPVLQRLTVPQHRRTLADLVGMFRQGPTVDDKRGVNVEIFKGRKMHKGELLVEQVDPGIDFRVNKQHPLHDKFDPKGFSARWTGSLIAPETGEYEIVVRSDQAVRLWVNHDTATGGGTHTEVDQITPPLIDGWVQSADQTEHRARLTLLGGRAYPLVLDFSCHNQGVGDDRQHKKKPEHNSYVSVSWKPPHGVEEIIPRRALSPVKTRATFVCTAPFPADDRSHGYERGVGMSRAWLTAVTDAAIEASDYIVSDLDRLASTNEKDHKRDEKVRRFCESFVTYALRRPLDEATRNRYIDAPLAGAPNLDAGVKRVLLLTLSSPRFLYPEAQVTTPDGWAIASRLALTMWDSIPDAELRKAAERGELINPDVARAQAQRMLADPRAATKLRGFFHEWLELDRAENVAKDDNVFPEYDEALLADLRTSLELFLDDVVWSEASDYRQLLLADYLYMNDRLRRVYGVEASGGSDAFERITVDKQQRSGVITHPYLLTAFAYHNSTSPIHRGVFLTRNIVGRQLKPPPKAISLADAKFEPNLTMREKVTRFTRDTACMSCHATINPLGFSLEHYDGIGRWRTKEDDKPINATSDFVGDDGGSVKLTGARDVAEFAVESEPARRAFVRLLFQHMTKQDTSAYGPERLDALEDKFAANQFHVRKLVADIAAVAATDGIQSTSNNAAGPRSWVPHLGAADVCPVPAPTDNRTHRPSGEVWHPAHD